MRHLSFIILWLSFCCTAEAQLLRGTIKDAQGEPIPYATVYIKELKQGTTANTKGNYEIRLPEGKYSVIWESLGYEPELKDIVISRTPLTINIILQVQTYEIPEVRITASGEDPAYGIMRRAIGMAPYYLNQISSYKADVYLKGNLLLTRIPKLLKRQMKVEARRNEGGNVSNNMIKEGDTYMMESFNQIEFTAPDKYKQHVISSQSTFPEQGNGISPMDFIRASFYQPVLNEMFISPLSPEAFFHYKFRYLGVSSQGDYYIDKIEVKPKRKSQQLFEGTIYVIEDLWCLHSVDLTNDNLAGKIRVQQLFIPVQENVWMPVSDKFDVNISILGIKGDAGYGSSIKYSEVSLNQKLKKPEGLQEFKGRTITDNPPRDTLKNKTAEQIDKILQKKELSNRDMAKLSNLLTKQSKESLPDSARNKLEVDERTTYVIEKDANKKDSTYWAGIRPIPLSDNEVKSLRASDSLKTGVVRTGEKADSTKKAPVARMKPGQFPGALAFGHTWSDTSGFSFNNGGLVNFRNLNFNTVDGFVYGLDFRISKVFSKKIQIGLYPSFLYAFSRESFMWRVNSQVSSAKNNRNRFYFRTGSTTKDFNSGGGISPLINSVTTLFLRSNYLKLYSARYLTVGYSREISNGLNIDLQAGYENRTILGNTTDYSFIKSSKIYTDNIPVNEYIKFGPDTVIRDHRHFDFSLTLQYTPRQKYVIRGGNRIPRGSDWPTFSLTWKHGVNDFTVPVLIGQYDQVRFEVFHNKDFGAFSEFRWRFRTGTFLRKAGFTFIDFNHFNTQYVPVLLKDYEDAFMLKPFYSLSTPQMFTELHAKYTTPYLLLKLIPGLSNTLMRENLSLSFLWTKDHQAYTELGYSISELLFIGELGVYAGFNNFNYASIGLRLVFKLD